MPPPPPGHRNSPPSRRPNAPRRDAPPRPPKPSKQPHRAPAVDLPAGLAPLTPPPGFADRCRDELGVEFDEGDLERLGLFLALLLEANKAVNLTAITTVEDAWERHIFDALTLVPLLASELPAEGGLVADLGSGGGVPGLPLAICLPHLRFTLVESTGKKVDLLRAFIDRLGLTNARVEPARAERIGHERHVHRGAYHAVTARALGHLAILVELGVPLLRFGADDGDTATNAPGAGATGGLLFAVKGAKAEQELEEATEAMCLLKARHVQTVTTPTGRIVVLEKVGPTDRVYPRREGEPKRAPLGIDRTAP